ncbi:MAG: OmpH family outer membrane protein [Phycisphaerales bacterium]
MRIGTGVMIAGFVALVVGVVAGASASGRASISAERPMVAVCDVFGVVETLMDSDRYQPARKEAGEAADKALAPLRERLEALGAKGRSLPETDPSLPDLAREYQRAQAELQQRTAEAAREMETLTSKQLKEAYLTARASADAVAEQLGFAYVVASRLPDKEVDGTDSASVVRAMLARPVLRFPEDADITADVLADLKLD